MHIGSGVDYGDLEQVCGAMVREVGEFGQDWKPFRRAAGLSTPYQAKGVVDQHRSRTRRWKTAREQIANMVPCEKGNSTSGVPCGGSGCAGGAGKR
ncbi:hypothetical protein ACNKHO_17825 [Shigella flexneri]